MKKNVCIKFLFLMLTVVFMSGRAEAQTYQRTSQGVKSTIQGGIFVEISFFTPSTVRILKSPEGWSYTKESLSVVGKPENVRLSITQKGGVLVVKSDRLTVNLDQGTGRITFTSPAGKPLLKEHEKGARFDDFNDAGVKTFSVYQSFALEKEEAIYGLGQLQNGKMSQRNQTKRLVQDNLEDVITFFQSVKGYGIFWDNYSPTTFKDDGEETSFLSEVGDCIDYYFMYGGNADGVVAQMRRLTGQVPMFPLWTYGFWQSKERYKSQSEIVGVVRKYRELGVPLDGIIQDWRYWGSNYLWNAMDFLNEEFPDPKKMMEDIHGENAHMIISIWSAFGPHTKPYRELDKGNMLFDFKTWPESGSSKWPPDLDYPSGARVYDAYNPQARDIYWKYLNQNLLPLGIDGWWMDSTEPDHLHVKPEDFDTPTYLGSFRKVRNAYPLMSVGGVYDRQRAATSDKRVFILTRSAFAGQQRYGANTWTGDITASWEVLEKQIPAGLNFSLCGIPHWNSDIGGFFLWQYPLMLKDPDYRELYARWVQFGAFCPMMRSHGEGAPREIYQFGKKGEPVYDAIAKYINLRYSLLPYIYSTSWEVTANQSSFMRALAMDFAEDRNVWDIHNQYMFGKSLLVCPVTQPMYTKKVTDTVRVEDFGTVKSTRVYLPEGADWYDFWTNKKQTGGQYIQKETPIDIMPLYVRAGSILPTGPKVQYATEKRWDNLEIRVYPGSNGEFTLYEDENDNYNYEKGMYSTIAMKWNDRARTLTIEERKGEFTGMLKSRNFNIVTMDGGRKTVSYNGKKMVVKLLPIARGEKILPPDKSGMETDAIGLVSKMTMGWNLGNTLEAIGGETGWGNPVTTEEMIVKIKEYGYNAVRLPCAWDQYLEDQTSYKIKDSWMARVKEVVDYCINNDMYVVLNIHWDGGWLENNCTPDKQAAVNIKQNALWEQIAVHFRDYDERLLFAGCNEPNAKNEEQAEVLRSYEQTFIDAVRRSGGRNAYRNLVVSSPETNIDKAETIMKLPEDTVENRMIVEVHYYDPFNFCIMNRDESWGKMAYFWGEGYQRYAVGKYEGRFSTWGLEDHLIEQFRKMKRNFTDKGIPSILGEFGAARRRLGDPEMQLAHDRSRGYFYRMVTEQAKNHGVVPFIWETGGVFNRRDNMRITDPEVYNGMVLGAEAGKYPY